MPLVHEGKDEAGHTRRYNWKGAPICKDRRKEEEPCQLTSEDAVTGLPGVVCITTGTQGAPSKPLLGDNDITVGPLIRLGTELFVLTVTF
jgi:hypothetical protein